MLRNRRWEKRIRLGLRGMSDKDCMRGLLFIGRGTWKIRGIYSLSVLCSGAQAMSRGCRAQQPFWLSY
jgi:hypothetical protein